MSTSHNIFISHRHEDDSHIEKLKALLKARGRDVRDSSINSDNPNDAKSEAYIKSILADRITWAGTMIVLVSPQTKDHEWVDWEIEYASKFPDKRIVGVWVEGAENTDLPEALQKLADSVVKWDADAIIAAIDGADNWQQTDGSATPPRQIPRINC